MFEKINNKILESGELITKLHEKLNNLRFKLNYFEKNGSIQNFNNKNVLYISCPFSKKLYIKNY